MSNLVPTRTSGVVSFQLLGLCWCLQLFLHRGRTLQFSLLNSLRFLSVNLSSLLMPQERSALPSGLSTTLFCIILKPAEGGSTVPSCRSLMLNTVQLSTDQRVHHEHQLGIVVLLTCENNVGSGDKSLAEFQTHRIGSSPFIHQTSHLTVEGSPAGETWFLLCNSTPIPPIHLLIFRSLEIISIQQQVVGVFFLIAFTSTFLMD